ncbi:MAG TPA: patatin-like phospholipase family protein [Burkholderiaceae bacterium]|nr:patatin-like phospholipase family protein [Burkholderiaceae bacterium]
MTTAAPHREALLAEQLKRLLGDTAVVAMDYLREHLQWVELAGGDVLMEQGQPGDSGYLMVSGRLRIYVRDDSGAQRMVREIARGEVIGEMSLFTGEPRSATVVAVRDSVLVKLDKPRFDGLVALSPLVSQTLTRQIIQRLQTQNLRRPLPPPVTIGVLPVSDGVSMEDFVNSLVPQLQRFGRVSVVDTAAMDRAIGTTGASATDGAAGDELVASALDAIEAANDFVLLIGDPAPGAWTRRCVRHGDELLLLADAAQPAVIHDAEQSCVHDRTARTEAAEILVLMHPADAKMPRGTREWLARRPVTGHVHLRRGLDRDMARLARLLSRNAVGLVFAGGGARGFAHLGIWRALLEQGVEVDCVGGTSIGSVMAALVAADQPMERAVQVARKGFSGNPTGDYNWLPLISLIKGRRQRKAITGSLRELVGDGVAIEDLWKTYFCVATNYSQAREHHIDSGDLARALLASTAIPGALPPVVSDGDLLCDGGTFNNFPVDRMREQRGVGQVLGVDLGARHVRRLDFDEVPGSWALLRDRFRPHSKRRYRLPSLMSYLLNVTILYSMSRQDEARRQTDVYFCPPLYKVGLLQWSRFDQILRQGYEHGLEVLGKLDDRARAALTGKPGRAAE